MANLSLVPMGLLCVLPHYFLRSCLLSSYKSEFRYRLFRTRCFLLTKLWAQIGLLCYQKAWGHRSCWNFRWRFQWIKHLTQELPWGSSQIPPLCFLQTSIKMASVLHVLQQKGTLVWHEVYMQAWMYFFHWRTWILNWKWNRSVTWLLHSWISPSALNILNLFKEWCCRACIEKLNPFYC